MDKCGNYFLEDLGKIGRGGFGEVYRVNVYNLTQTRVSAYARKYFSPSEENAGTFARELADLRGRFVVESKAQANLNVKNYDFIAPIVLVNQNGDNPYFVMELAECNLIDAIKNGLSDVEKEYVVQQIIRGVKAIHDDSYIHRDLKPANILKYSDGKYKISDFGLVKDLNDVRAEIKTRFKPNGIGSDGYRAPEITDNGLFSSCSDIYALGKIINDVYKGGASDEIKAIISKCRSYFSDDRYKTADEVLAAFMAAVKTMGGA